MEIIKNQMWKDSHNNIFVVDVVLDSGKVRCHRACTTEEVRLNIKDFENMEYLRPQNNTGWDDIDCEDESGIIAFRDCEREH